MFDNTLSILEYIATTSIKSVEYRLTDDLIGVYPQYTTSPDAIQEWSRRELPNHWNVLRNSGRTSSGNWDIKQTFHVRESFDREYYLDIVYDDIKLKKTTFYNSLLLHFIEDVPWEDTEYYSYLSDVLEADGSVVWGGRQTSKKDLHNRAEEIDTLYQNIRRDGYKTQKELNRSLVSRIENEILVDISRSGTPLLVDGKHRLTIAKLLNLDTIPVTVMFVHKNWAEHAGENLAAVDGFCERIK